MKKRIFVIALICIIVSISFFILKNKKLKKYTTNLFYMDTYINITIYSDNKLKANKLLEEIDNIYNVYHQLTDKYNSYNINNLYYINNNNDNIDTLEIDSRLYELLQFGKDWYLKSNKLLNINMGEVIDLWKKYRDSKEGIPSDKELYSIEVGNVDDIVLMSNNKIKNNKPSIDLGAIAKGYVTEMVGNYLEEQGIDKYIINAGGNVKVGNHYDNGKYKIGIENPNNPSNIYEVINGNNISVVTSGGYQRFYEYNGIKYSHIIDPNTLYPSNYMKSVTVITQDSSIGDALSTTLFLMSVEDGIEYIKNFDGTEAIWVTNNDEIIKTDGVMKYE